MLTFRKKLLFCIPLLLSCLLSTFIVEQVSYGDYYYAKPPKNQDVAAFSELYFRVYRVSWVLLAIFSIWGIRLIVKRETTYDHLLLFIAFILLYMQLLTVYAFAALHMANQTYVFRFQGILNQPEFLNR